MEHSERVASRRSARIDDSIDTVCAWSIPDTEACCTIPAAVVNRLKAEVKRGFYLLPKRGAEVGGVLLGNVLADDPLTVHIADFVPIPCQYRFGPSFTLSTTDLEGLEQLLAGLAERTDVSIVGYFRSCTGRDLALDNADTDVMEAHFRGPSMIVLSIKPFSLIECVAWFFFRRNGVLPTVPTHAPLPFDDKQLVAPPQPKPMEAPVALALLPTHDDPPAEPPAPYRRPAWHWLALSLMLAVASFAGYQAGVATRPPLPPPPPSPPVVVLPQAATTAPLPPKPLLPTVPASLIQQAYPEIPPGIRTRIETAIVISVEAAIDARGKVTSARSVGDGDGLFRYLAERAAIAAQASTFRPARAADGTPVPSTSQLSFVFEPSAH